MSDVRVSKSNAAANKIKHETVYMQYSMYAIEPYGNAGYPGINLTQTF